MTIRRGKGRYDWIDRGLKKALSGRHERKPDILKPERLQLLEMPDSQGSWERFCFRNYLEMFYLTEERRERAERVGIIYERPLIEMVPKEHRPRMVMELAEYRKELEEFLSLASDRGYGVSASRIKLRACINPETIFAVRMMPITPLSPSINHDLAALPFDGLFRPDLMAFTLLCGALGRGFLHNPKYCDRKEAFVYLKEYGMDAEKGAAVFGSGEALVRFHIDTRRLLETRSVFTDPEGMDASSEYGRTYIVRGGIPACAIAGWSVWQGDDPPGFEVRG